jgi:hypothetical protein
MRYSFEQIDYYVHDNREESANYKASHYGEEELKISLLKEYVARKLS